MYGWPKEVPCTEESALSGMSPYGRTKVLGSFRYQSVKLLFGIYPEMFSQICSCSLRTFAVMYKAVILSGES